MRHVHRFLPLVLLVVLTGGILRAEETPPAPKAAPNHRIVVFYLHTTFRCHSCLLVEQLTKTFLYGGTVDKSLNIKMDPVVSPFADEVKKGTLEFVSLNVDLEENKPLAEALGNVMITPVVAEVRNGVVVSYVPLNQAGALRGNLDAFKTYLYGAIRQIAKEKDIVPLKADHGP